MGAEAVGSPCPQVEARASSSQVKQLRHRHLHQALKINCIILMLVKCIPPKYKCLDMWGQLGKNQRNKKGKETHWHLDQHCFSQQ